MSQHHLNAPHPLVTSETLYLADVPSHLEWSHLEPTLSKCGYVMFGGRGRYAGSSSWMWTVHFKDVFHAEMALATLQDTEIHEVQPAYKLKLSHSPSLLSSAPPHPLFPQYVKSKTSNHPILACTPQKLFEWFRYAGPLVYLRVNVNVGFPEPTVMLEYWDEVHAAYSHKNCRLLHPMLKNMKPFALRTIVPTNILCSNLGAAFHENDIRGRFKKFGTITNLRVLQPKTSNCHAYITYSTRENAASAQEQMHGKIFGQAKLIVRFYEPKAQYVFRSATCSDSAKSAPEPKTTGSTAAPDAKCEKPPTATPPAAEEPPRPTAQEEAARKAQREQELCRQKQADVLRLRNESQRRRAEAESVIAANAKKREAATAARKVAEEAERRANIERRNAEVEELEQEREVAWATEEYREASDARFSAHATFLRASTERQLAHERFLQAEAAFKEAERVLEAEKLGNAKAGERLKAAEDCAKAAEQQQWEATKRRRDALAEEMRLKSNKERAETQEEEVIQRTQDEDSEAVRLADLAESMWKLNDLYVQEGKDRVGTGGERKGQESEEQGAEAKREETEQGVNGRRDEETESDATVPEEGNPSEEELRRREDEEAARRERAREEELRRRAYEEASKREREAQLRRQAVLEEELRRRAYEEAVKRERERCKLRDSERWPVRTGWTSQQAIDRFKAVSIEFDEIKFSSAQPLVFESVPWPLLRHPANHHLDIIDWAAVERFFSAMRVALKQSEYKVVVEKAHRRFHPDKWRSRGLLLTIEDCALRDQLEAAGNIVAQAITPLWIESKAMA